MTKNLFEMYIITVTMRDREISAAEIFAVMVAKMYQFGITDHVIANSAHPDQTEQSDLGLHCFLKAM